MNNRNSLEKIKEDYETLVSGKGLVKLKDWTTVTMTGADRQTLLHNLCTNDINRLSAGESCEAFCTNVQGKIVAHVFVFALEDRLELLTVPGQAESLMSHLDRYIIREDVTLADSTRGSTEDFSWGFVGGDDTASKAGLPGRFVKGGGTGIACCMEAWEALRIEAGLPLFQVDFDDTHLPQEVNRDEQAISFNKGCYLGQETVARIDALGHVNRKVVLLKFEGEAVPPVGLELSVAGKGDAGKSVGRVTSGCWSPRFAAPLALAMVRRGSNELETPLESDLGTATVITPSSGHQSATS